MYASRVKCAKRELSAAGVYVFKALAVSEVLNLLQHQRIDAVVITEAISDVQQAAVRGKVASFELKPGAQASAVVWELSTLFGSDCLRVH